MLCYAMLGGFAFYLAKRVHDSTEIKPYSFTLPWRLICHQDNVSSTSVPKTYLDRYASENFMDLGKSSVR